MKASEWRACQREAQTLPVSGIDVVLKHVKIEDLAAHGAIPAPMLQYVKGLQAQPPSEEKVFEQLPHVRELYDVVVKACLVEPKLVDDESNNPVALPEGEYLLLSELSFRDRQFIFEWANKGADALAPFRPGPAEPDHAARDGEGIRAAAEPDFKGG